MPNPSINRRVLANASGPGIDPVVTAWALSVVANGGAMPSQPTINAYDTFWKALIAGGISSKMIIVNGIAPDSTVAALTPLVAGSGLNPWVIVGGVSLSVNGLTCTGNAGYFRTGANPTVMYANDNNSGWSVYNSQAGGVSGDSLGMCYNGGTGWGRFGTGFIASYNVWDFGPYTSTINGTPGFTSCNRTGAAALAVYEARSNVAFNTAASGSTAPSGRPNLEVWFGAWNNNGSPANGQASRISFAAFHVGLTSAEANVLFNATQALRTSFGGGFA